MIGAPPPLPGRKAKEEPEVKKPKRTKPIVIKAKGKTKPKVKADKPEVQTDVTNDSATPDQGMTLIAKLMFFGQWQILNHVPVKGRYKCACICSETATVTLKELQARPVCNHKGSDQNFRKNREGAKEFKALVNTGLIPRELIDFNDWLKRRAKTKHGYSLITVAPGIMWEEHNLLEVPNRNRTSALELQALQVTENETALQLIKKYDLDLANALRYLKEHGELKTQTYLLRKVKRLKP